MATNLNLNTVNQIVKGTVLYAENEQINSVCLILKGRALVYNNGMKTIMGSGSFLGISDVFSGRYLCNYIAYDNMMIFAFPVTKEEEIENILNVNKDYNGLMVSYLNKYITELYKTENALRSVADRIYTFLMVKCNYYVETSKKYGHIPVPIRSADNLDKYSSEIVLDRNRITYYTECAKIPIDVQKSYFSNGNQITLYHIKEQSNIILNLNSECIELATYVGEYFQSLINDQTDCLYKCVAKLAIDILVQGGRNDELVSVIDEIIGEINDLESVITQKAGYQVVVDREKMEEIYFILLTGDNDNTVSTDIQMKYSDQNATKAKEEMKGSLNQILNYSDLTQERKEEIGILILDFINLKVKDSVEDQARLLRKRIAEGFYELYYSVFVKWYKTKSANRVIDLFLSYGYIDENLITKDQLIELYFLQDENNQQEPCKVYTIKQWLTAVMDGEKEPSKSEFDMDYAENLREIKRTRSLTREEENEYIQNPYKKLEYEIQNMFRYNNRIANGQISIFVPILYSDLFSNNIQKSYLTSNIINHAVNEVLKVDYSAFYREVLYYDEEKGIKKEYIMKQVFPDIILMPTVGYNPIMWQEISGKKRDTSGRFMLPTFVTSDLFEMMLKLVGKFRWELCRTMQGTLWNNITERSLTSEYVDYIQFFRKNRDLTEERKEKLKLQIQKGKNNSREIFLIDYILWVKNESQGALRLNKTAREILATYCPFSRVVRERIAGQPLFEEAMARYIREKNKRTKELDLRLRVLEKEKIVIPSELLSTQTFYTDL